MPEVIIRVRNQWSVIEGMPFQIRNELYELLSFDVPGAKYSPKFKDNIEDPEEREKGWDGKIHLYKKWSDEYLTGLTYRVYEHFKNEYNVIPTFIWEMKKPPKTLDLQWNYDKYEIRPYQKKIIDTCVQKGRAVIEACTGSGKSIVVSKIIQELGVAPFLFYTLTKDLMYQTQEKLEDSIPGLKVGIIGDGECEIRDINVVTIQTVIFAEYGEKYFKKALVEIKASSGMDDNEYKEFKKEKIDHIIKKREPILSLIKKAKGIYSDEVHHWSSRTCKDVMMLSPNAYYRFGGSATPVRADNSYLTIEGLFGRKTSIITASELIKTGWLMKPTIRFIEVEGRPPITLTWAEDRKKNITECDERNTCIIKIARKLQEKNIKTLILIQVISHGKYLEKHVPGSIFVHGTSSKNKRKEIFAKFHSGEINTLISSTIADEGLDIPTLSALINCGGGKSPVRAKQRVGRVIRTGSPHALVFDFIDRGKWSHSHSKERMKLLKTEKEFDLKKITQSQLLQMDGEDLIK